MSTKTLSTRQFLLLAIGSAVILRLLLMPFFAHVDLFSEYRRVHYAIDHGFWLAHTHRVLTFYIEMVFVGFSKLFIPSGDLTFYLANPAKSTSSVHDYFLFLQDPYIYRYLFFFKLPYFIFDMAVAGVIWRFIDDMTARRIALLLWLFNPLTLYATYIFGRFEVFAIFFLALTALNLKQHRLILAAVTFGLALLCREIYVLLTPFFLLSCWDQRDHWLRNTLIIGAAGLIIGALYLFPDAIIPALGAPDPFIDPDANHNYFDKLFSFHVYWFYPVIFGLSLVAIYNWETQHLGHAQRFVICSGLVLLVYFTFNVHSAHYAAWLMLPPILAMQYGRQVVMPLLTVFVCWVIVRLFMTDSGVFTPFLAAPLSLDFVGTGHFPTWFIENFTSEHLIFVQAVHAARTLFDVSVVYLGYRLVRGQVQGLAK